MQGGKTMPAGAPPVSGKASAAGEGGPPASGKPPSPDGGFLYTLKPEERAQILTATSSKEVPVHLRNKMYSALKRCLDAGKMSDVVADEWAAAECKGHTGKFEFMQKWAGDTSGGTITLRHQVEQKTKEYEGHEFVWMNKMDLYLEKKAYENAEMKAYCDKLMASSKSKKHPDPKHKNDPEMKLYKVLGFLKEGKGEATKRKNIMDLEIEAEADAHKSILNQFAASKPVEEEAEKVPKKAKLTVDEMRLKIVQQDLKASAATVIEITTKPSQYLVPIKENLVKVSAELRTVAHKMHDEALNNDAEKQNALWAAAETLAKTMKGDIDCARALMHQGVGQFIPYSPAR